MKGHQLLKGVIRHISNFFYVQQIHTQNTCLSKSIFNGTSSQGYNIFSNSEGHLFAEFVNTMAFLTFVIF